MRRGEQNKYIQESRASIHFTVLSVQPPWTTAVLSLGRFTKQWRSGTGPQTDATKSCLIWLKAQQQKESHSCYFKPRQFTWASEVIGLKKESIILLCKTSVFLHYILNLILYPQTSKAATSHERSFSLQKKKKWSAL